MIIYKATNIINGKSYIGQTTKSLNYRITDHLRQVKSVMLFHKAIRKYGKESFVWEVLCTCDDREELDEMEFHYIIQYNTYGKDGYNQTLGGNGGHGYKHSIESIKKNSEAHSGRNHHNYGKHLSEETKQKIGKANAGENNGMFGKGWLMLGDKNPNYGKKPSDETILKRSKSNTGKKRTEETKQRMSEAKKGKKFTEEHIENLRKSHLGQVHSEEHKRKISDSLKGNKNRANNNITLF